MGQVASGKVLTDLTAADGGRMEGTPAAALAAEMPVDALGRSIPALRPEATTTKITANAAGGASTKSAAVGTAGIYRVWASVDVYLQVGTNPTASETYPMSAGIPEKIRLNAADCVAALAIGSVAGSVFLTMEK